MISEEELNFLHIAVRLAEHGHGTAEPNPLVGCIITDSEGAVVGEGIHEKFGEEHAEVNALTIAGDKARGGTAYVTLEPCNHQGKTPPCCKALIDAGISRVVIGTRDPHIVATGGIETLVGSGIEVDIVEDALCQELLAPFARKVQAGLPWITCKWAQTKNGSLETPEGESQWISSPESQHLVHAERGCMDAIIVGVGTVVADNPSLTVRGVTKHRTPIRVIIDPHLRSPKDAMIFDKEAPTLIACKEGADTSVFFNCEFIELPMKNNVLDLTKLFEHLVSKHDVTHAIVEGGATLFSHIFAQKLASELWVFVAPMESSTVPSIDMNVLREELNTTLIHEDSCGVDSVFRYLVTQ